MQAQCRIPGNFLAEGGLFITVAVTSLQPTVVHIDEMT